MGHCIVSKSVINKMHKLNYRNEFWCKKKVYIKSGSNKIQAIQVVQHGQVCPKVVGKANAISTHVSVSNEDPSSLRLVLLLKNNGMVTYYEVNV